jgi:hypothetical protein
MPTQDRLWGDQAMATQRSGQPPDEGGEHGPVRPVPARSWVGAAQDGDLVAQHEELHVLGDDDPAQFDGHVVVGRLGLGGVPAGPGPVAGYVIDAMTMQCVPRR